jgi:hypothetical protein
MHYEDDNDYEVGTARKFEDYRGFSISKRIDTVNSSKFDRFVCGSSFLTTDSIEKMRAQIDEHLADKEKSIEKARVTAEETRRSESAVYWSKALAAAALGAAGFGIAGPVGAIAGIVIGSLV